MKLNNRVKFNESQAVLKLLNLDKLNKSEIYLKYLSCFTYQTVSLGHQVNLPNQNDYFPNHHSPLANCKISKQQNMRLGDINPHYLTNILCYVYKVKEYKVVSVCNMTQGLVKRDLKKLGTFIYKIYICIYFQIYVQWSTQLACLLTLGSA